jgi:hypothetical protein
MEKGQGMRWLKGGKMTNLLEQMMYQTLPYDDGRRLFAIGAVPSFWIVIRVIRFKIR